MALVLNGSTGVTSANIADGSIAAGDLASASITAAKIGYAGAVLQVVDSGPMTTGVSNTTTTFADANCTATITPLFSTSKILIIVSQEVQVWNSGNPYATGRWKLMRSIGGGSFTDVYVDYSTSNGNVFAYDYGGSGINVYRPTTYPMVDNPATTSAVVYKTQIAKGSNGGQMVGTNANSPGRMILMEIAG